MLRYQENNELHKDFHSSTNMTLDYIAGKYGVDALKMILRRTGKNVYKSIHDKLARGDASELVEHLNWFFMREKGKYQLTVEDDKIVFEVFECSATVIYRISDRLFHHTAVCRPAKSTLVCAKIRCGNRICKSLNPATAYKLSGNNPVLHLLRPPVHL